MDRANRLVPSLLRLRMGGRTQRDFAADLGISEALLSRVLRGERVFGRRSAGLIAAKFPEMRGLLAEALVGTTAADGIAEAAG